MTAARSQLVDVNVTRYYQCISRCVRRALLCREGFEHCKQWIEDRLQTLSECFAASVCGFAVMDNHLHVLVRLEPDAANGWSPEDVVRRWLGSYFSVDRARLRQLARQRGVHHLDNVVASTA